MITSLQPRLQGLTVDSQTDTLRSLDPVHPMAREELHLLTLSSNRELIEKHLVVIGTIPSEALADILRYALYDQAEAVILVRTVKGNARKPTARERKLLDDLQGLSELLGIEICDYIRTGPNGSYSRAEEEEDMPF